MRLNITQNKFDNKIECKETKCMSKFNERELINGRPMDNSSKTTELNNKKESVTPKTENTAHNIKKEGLGPNTKR